MRSYLLIWRGSFTTCSIFTKSTCHLPSHHLSLGLVSITRHSQLTAHCLTNPTHMLTAAFPASLAGSTSDRTCILSHFWSFLPTQLTHKPTCTPDLESIQPTAHTLSTNLTTHLNLFRSQPTSEEGITPSATAFRTSGLASVTGMCCQPRLLVHYCCLHVLTP